MANFMYVLRPTEKTRKTVCPACAARGEVIDTCPVCRGSAVKGYRVTQFYVQDRPVQIDHVDRDPKTGILRYWESTSDCYYETTTSEINKYMPDVPNGLHLCHEERRWADNECERVNQYLASKAAAEKASGLANKF